MFINKKHPYLCGIIKIIIVMSKQEDFIWKALWVISWIIFIGFCIETGAFLFNYIFSLFRPEATNNLYNGLNLSDTYLRSKVVYSFLFSFIIVISGLKAFVFYQVIKIFMKLNLVKPFSEEVSQLITGISYFSFAIGIISEIAHKFTKNIVQKGYQVDTIEKFWNDSAVFLMMAAILYIISLVFKKGIELQNENDLTV